MLALASMVLMEGTMIRTMFALVGALCIAGSAIAAGKPTETTIGIKSYRSLFESQGGSKHLPKILVYSPRGECVGVTTADKTPAGKLEKFVEASLKQNKKACTAVLSAEFGQTAVGRNAGTGRPGVVFIALKGNFCNACNDYRMQFPKLTMAGFDVATFNVDLSTAHNPKLKSAKDCPTCGKKP